MFSKNINDNSNWFILKTRSNFEKKVYSQLIDKEYVAFLPLYQTIRVWSDRKKKVELPLIPTYVFVYCSVEELSKVVQTNGVAWILKDRQSYAVVQDYEIQNLKIYLSETTDFENQKSESFEIGEEIRVVKGPFSGIIGKAVQNQGVFRVVIEINSIGTQFTINVPKSHVEKLRN